jgi:hypothetical protein
MAHTGTYVYDASLKRTVKVSDKPAARTGWQEQDMPFAQKIMRGYRECESRGERIYGKASNIKKIWGMN